MSVTVYVCGVYILLYSRVLSGSVELELQRLHLAGRPLQLDSLGRQKTGFGRVDLLYGRDRPVLRSLRVVVLQSRERFAFAGRVHLLHEAQLRGRALFAKQVVLLRRLLRGFVLLSVDRELLHQTVDRHLCLH